MIFYLELKPGWWLCSGSIYKRSPESLLTVRSVSRRASTDVVPQILHTKTISGVTVSQQHLKREKERAGEDEG